MSILKLGALLLTICSCASPLLFSILTNPPFIVAAFPLPLAFVTNKPSPFPFFVIFNAIPLPLVCVIPKVLLPPELVKDPVAPVIKSAVKSKVPKFTFAVAPVYGT